MHCIHISYWQRKIWLKKIDCLCYVILYLRIVKHSLKSLRAISEFSYSKRRILRSMRLYKNISLFVPRDPRSRKFIANILQYIRRRSLPARTKEKGEVRLSHKNVHTSVPLRIIVAIERVLQGTKDNSRTPVSFRLCSCLRTWIEIRRRHYEFTFSRLWINSSWPFTNAWRFKCYLTLALEKRRLCEKAASWKNATLFSVTLNSLSDKKRRCYKGLDKTYC